MERIRFILKQLTFMLLLGSNAFAEKPKDRNIAFGKELCREIAILEPRKLDTDISCVDYVDNKASNLNVYAISLNLCHEYSGKQKVNAFTKIYNEGLLKVNCFEKASHIILKQSSKEKKDHTLKNDESGESKFSDTASGKAFFKKYSVCVDLIARLNVKLGSTTVAYASGHDCFKDLFFKINKDYVNGDLISPKPESQKAVP